MDATSKNDARLAELKIIADRNDGILLPEQVVEFAKRKTSALHDAFEWDDTEAARKYRLEQARAIIRVSVEIIDAGGNKEPIAAWVNLIAGRHDDGAGYRYAPGLMATDAGRKSILETALWELRAFQNKYARLTELAGVFAAINKAAKKVSRK